MENIQSIKSKRELFHSLIENAYNTLKYSNWMKDLWNCKVTLKDIAESLEFEHQLKMCPTRKKLTQKDIDACVEQFLKNKSKILSKLKANQKAHCRCNKKPLSVSRKSINTKKCKNTKQFYKAKQQNKGNCSCVGNASKRYAEKPNMQCDTNDESSSSSEENEYCKNLLKGKQRACSSKCARCTKPCNKIQNEYNYGSDCNNTKKSLTGKCQRSRLTRVTKIGRRRNNSCNRKKCNATKYKRTPRKSNTKRTNIVRKKRTQKKRLARTAKRGKPTHLINTCNSHSNCPSENMDQDTYNTRKNSGKEIYCNSSAIFGENMEQNNNSCSSNEENAMKGELLDDNRDSISSAISAESMAQENNACFSNRANTIKAELPDNNTDSISSALSDESMEEDNDACFPNRANAIKGKLPDDNTDNESFTTSNESMQQESKICFSNGKPIIKAEKYGCSDSSFDESMDNSSRMILNENMNANNYNWSSNKKRAIKKENACYNADYKSMELNNSATCFPNRDGVIKSANFCFYDSIEVLDKKRAQDNNCCVPAKIRARKGVKHTYSTKRPRTRKKTVKGRANCTQLKNLDKDFCSCVKTAKHKVKVIRRPKRLRSVNTKEHNIAQKNTAKSLKRRCTAKSNQVDCVLDDNLSTKSLASKRKRRRVCRKATNMTTKNNKTKIKNNAVNCKNAESTENMNAE